MSYTNGDTELNIFTSDLFMLSINIVFNTVIPCVFLPLFLKLKITNHTLFV